MKTKSHSMSGNQFPNPAQKIMMSLSNGIKKSILPKNHEQINNVYKKRLDNYLNLVAVHGENNTNDIVKRIIAKDKTSQAVMQNRQALNSQK